MITPAYAQDSGQTQTDSEWLNDGPLDPDEPLADIPDFGVDWPDMEVAEEQIEEEAVEAAENDSEKDSEKDSAEASEKDSAEISELDETQDSIQNLSDNSITADEFIDDAFQPADALAETEYRVQLTGLPDDIGEDFRTRFDALSALKQYKGEDVNFAQIKRRAESDRDLTARLLRIYGYYDAIVRTRFAADASSTDPNDVAVSIEMVAGPQYKLANISLPGLEQASGDDPAQFRQVFGLEAGNAVDSDEIVIARLNLDTAMSENGYPFAVTGEPDLLIDHAQRSGDLTVEVIPGGRYAFGSIIMAQEELFNARHVAQIARFDPGDVYKASDVEDLRRALIATGLVSTVALEPVKSPDPQAVDLAVNVTAAPLRTISGELGYGTGEGLRSEIAWEHRNYFPPEGLIRLAAVLATQEQAGSVTFRRNNFRRRDNVLNARIALSNVDRPAFAARTVALSANLERQSNLIYQKKWSWSVGGELLATQERDISGPNDTTSRDTFFIAAIPATLTYDASDDLLDPRKGFRIGGRISPEASLQDGSFFYVRSQLDGSAYLPVNDRVTVAGRVRLGSIAGVGNNRIAPSRRLYSGGGASVRGYGFQQVGPRDVNNDPLGGRSLAEFSLEARVRLKAFGGNFGIVPFIDAGNVYANELPDFTGLRFGAGLGVRYYSNFGPIRVDVGTPINPQPGDSPIAVYVSLGQAF